jgi:hypothetical protein
MRRTSESAMFWQSESFIRLVRHFGFRFLACFGITSALEMVWYLYQLHSIIQYPSILPPFKKSHEKAIPPFGLSTFAGRLGSHTIGDCATRVPVV